MKNRLSHIIFDKSGAVIVEAALVLPLLIIAALGAIDASYMMLQNHKLESQLSMAASYLSRSDNPVNFETSAKNIALTGGTIANASPILKGWSLADIKISYLSTNNEPDEDGVTLYRGDATVKTVVIASQLDYKGIGILSSLSPQKLALKAVVEERVVGGGL